ncbi:hypothetical protein BJX65DRAFT_143321 [Aspergillus insuetus]
MSLGLETHTHPHSRVQPQGYPPSTRTVNRLIRIYRDTMYQCYFPFLPEKDLLTRWEDGISSPSTASTAEKKGQETSRMLLMALCAVASQTVSMNAVFDTTLVQGLSARDTDERFYFERAVEMVPKITTGSSTYKDDDDHNTVSEYEEEGGDGDKALDPLRAFGLLAVYSLRAGTYSNLHTYLSLYHALSAQHNFHDETLWPSSLSLQDIDDRRRLFWCVYRLEIHSACVLGHPVRMPEASVCVQYPRITPGMSAEMHAWTVGWSYVTDLFRLLEYAISCLRGARGGNTGGTGRKACLAVLCERPAPTTLVDSLSQLKTSKPRILRGLGMGELRSNRCMYMSVQITCTETLVSIMALLYCQAPAWEVMAIAEGFLEEVTRAPLIMFKVASSQIVHQLLGVGHMLRNASQYENGRYRTEAKRLIMFLGDLVGNLEGDIPSAVGAGERLIRLAEATSPSSL